MSMRKISHIFGLRTSRDPKDRQISHYLFIYFISRTTTSTINHIHAVAFRVEVRLKMIRHCYGEETDKDKGW